MRVSLRLIAVIITLVVFPSIRPAHAGSAIVRWHATGDDSIFGRATAYDLRYNTMPITAANFGSAMGVPAVPPPAPAGTPESFVINGLMSGITYYFAIKVRDEAGNWSKISNVIAKVPMSTVDVGDDQLMMLSFSQPRPNPARSGSLFVMQLPATSKVLVEAFDVTGRRVRTLADQEYSPGEYPVRWDLYDDQGRRVSPGMYKVRARLGNSSFIRNVVII
jgi:hypothetical protein